MTGLDAFHPNGGTRGPGQKQAGSYRPQKHKLRVSIHASEKDKHTLLKGQEMFYLHKHLHGSLTEEDTGLFIGSSEAFVASSVV